MFSYLTSVIYFIHVGYLRSNVEMRPSTNPSVYQLSLRANVLPSTPLPGTICFSVGTSVMVLRI